MSEDHRRCIEIAANFSVALFVGVAVGLAMWSRRS